MTEQWWQPELPFESGPVTPDGLRKKILDDIAKRSVSADSPTFSTGFILLQAADGTYMVITTPDWASLGLRVKRAPNPNEVMEISRTVSDHERTRHLADAIADRMRPRDLTQEALRKKARDRGVI